MSRPGWVEEWRTKGSCPAEALRRFDDLATVEPAAMLGRWQGAGLPAGHPLDGLLEALGWYGKDIESPDRVHPLLFRTASGPPVALEPAIMPVGLALRCPQLARGSVIRKLFAAASPLLQARRPGAQLRPLTFRGKTSAAMIYKSQPIIDHFRKLDEDQLIGLMQLEGSPRPYFFLLERIVEQKTSCRQIEARGIRTEV